MLSQVSSSIWGLVFLVALLMFATRGCGSRFDKFRERQEERRQEWKEQREERQDNRKERWDSWKERERIFGHRRRGE